MSDTPNSQSLPCPGADWLTGLTGADGEVLQFDPSLLEDEPAKGEKT